MKARFTQAGTGIQIVLNCESVNEKLLLREFLKNRENPNLEFCIHGFGGSNEDVGWQHMNFGFRQVNKKVNKKVNKTKEQTNAQE